jgi:hypothetical protein
LGQPEALFIYLRLVDGVSFFVNTVGGWPRGVSGMGFNSIDNDDMSPIAVFGI